MASNVIQLGDYRLDGWENALTGFGTSRDKTIYGSFYRNLLIGDSQLEALYAESDLAATAVDCVPEEMLRRGYKLCVAMQAEVPEVKEQESTALGRAKIPGQLTKPESSATLEKPGAIKAREPDIAAEKPASETSELEPAEPEKPVVPSPDEAGEPELSEEEPPAPVPQAPKPGTDDEKLSKAIIKELQKLGAHDKIMAADCWGRLYGGSVVVMGVDDGRPASMPLMPEKARKLNWLLDIDRRYISPMTFYQEGPKSGEPELYLVHKPGGAVALPGMSESFLVHETRLLIFRGVRTTFTERQARNYWDNSLLLRAFPIVRSFDTAFKAVETLLTDGAQAVYSMKGLVNYIGSAGEKALTARMQVIDMMRSVTRAMVIDADEKFERHNYTYSGLGEVLDKVMLRLAAAFRIPVTILMGQSPAGMNATGESDFRWFYDRIATRQENYYEPLLRRLIEVLCACKEGPTKGKVPEKIEFEWHSLWQPTDKEKAETNKIKVDTAVAAIGADIVTPEEVALSDEIPDYGIDRELREQAQQATKEAASMDPSMLRAHAPAGPPELDEDGNPVEPEDDADDQGSVPFGAKAGPSKAAPGAQNKPGSPKAKGKKPPFAR